MEEQCTLDVPALNHGSTINVAQLPIDAFCKRMTAPLQTSAARPEQTSWRQSIVATVEDF